MKKTFMMADVYSGMDWHDSCYTAEFISDKEDLSVEDPVLAIANDLISIV